MSQAKRLKLPAGFLVPKVPDENPMSEAKVILGRRLFYDPGISANQTQSFASCHKQELAFSDGLPVSVGSTGELTPRGSMALVNVAYNGTQTWANPALVSLEQQAAFVRTLISGNTPFDRYSFGNDKTALSPAALRGLGLFFTERLECFHCHGGFNFSSSITHALI